MCICIYLNVPKYNSSSSSDGSPDLCETRPKQVILLFPMGLEDLPKHLRSAGWRGFICGKKKCFLFATHEMLGGIQSRTTAMSQVKNICEMHFLCFSLNDAFLHTGHVLSSILHTHVNHQLVKITYLLNPPIPCP